MEFYRTDCKADHMIGVAGYVMLYTSLITLAARHGFAPSIIMYS